MTISKIDKYDSSKALNRALVGLDESCRMAFAYHLKERYEIDTLSVLALSEIEDAISDMFGEGANILLKNALCRASSGYDSRCEKPAFFTEESTPVTLALFLPRTALTIRTNHTDSPCSFWPESPKK